MRKILILASLAALAACSKPANDTDDSSTDVAASAAVGAPPPTPTPPKLAYAFHFGLEAPPDQVGGLFEKHQKACLDATPAVCQIVGAHFHQDRDGEPYGRLDLRATGAWIGAIKGGLAEDARRAGGALSFEESQATDVSGEIAGARAAIRHDEHVAKPTWATEENLAKSRATLAQDRARVAMSSVSLNYRTAPQYVGRETWRPVSQAARMSAKTVSVSLAVLLTLAVTLAPWLGLGLILWLAYRLISGRFAQRARVKGG